MVGFARLELVVASHDLIAMDVAAVVAVAVAVAVAEL